MKFCKAALLFYFYDFLLSETRCFCTRKSYKVQDKIFGVPGAQRAGRFGQWQNPQFKTTFVPLAPRRAILLHCAGMGTRYYGDNLDILRWYVKDESVNLVYLDPPFNSAQNNNAYSRKRTAPPP